MLFPNINGCTSCSCLFLFCHQVQIWVYVTLTRAWGDVNCPQAYKGTL